MPRFSVVIPLYNKENFIEATLKSVSEQSFQDFEILVVNDCATDTSLEVVKSVTDPRIRVIQHKKNKGLSASRNTGIRNASAPYIAFLDADDLWKPNFLEAMNHLIEKFGDTASLFASTYEIILSNGKKTTLPFPKLEVTQEGIIPRFFETSLGYNYYCMSSICAKKSLFEDVGYFDEKINYSKDVDFNIRVNLKHQVALLNEPLVTLNFVSENQITQSHLKGKVIPDYQFYEVQNPNHKALKKYLDFHRYVKAKLLKMEHAQGPYRQLKSEIDFNNLNWKQRLLLRLPSAVLKLIFKGKRFLLKNGVNVSSYS